MNPSTSTANASLDSNATGSTLPHIVQEWHGVTAKGGDWKVWWERIDGVWYLYLKKYIGVLEPFHGWVRSEATMKEHDIDHTTDFSDDANEAKLKDYVRTLKQAGV